MTAEMQGLLVMQFMSELDKAGKIISVATGNHDAFVDNFYRTFSRLEAPLLYNWGDTDITVGSVMYRLAQFHEFTMGNSTMSHLLRELKYLEMRSPNADIVVGGHTHRKAIEMVLINGVYRVLAETGKFVYTVTGNAGVQPQFIFPTTSTLYRQMGFEEASTNTFVGNTITSDNVLDFDLVSAIYILSDMCEPGPNQQQSSSVLQEIFAQNTVTYARIGFLNPCPEYTAKPIVKDRTVFTFSICDNDSRPLNLNGLQINLSLLVF
jgi:predicted phosphodiesterase